MNVNQIVAELSWNPSIKAAKTPFQAYKATCKLLMQDFSTPKIALNSSTAKLADYVLQYGQPSPLEGTYCNLDERPVFSSLLTCEVPEPLYWDCCHLKDKPVNETVAQPVVAPKPATKPSPNVVPFKRPQPPKAPKVYSFTDMVKVARKSILRPCDALTRLAA
jgi:hypothetical protein